MQPCGRRYDRLRIYTFTLLIFVVLQHITSELEWCGSHSFLFLAKRFIEAENKATELESRCASAENVLKTEKGTTANLKKMIKQNQRTAEDNEWQLQEQLAHSNSLIIQEKELSDELTGQLSDCQGKLIEVEAFLNSDNGKLTLQMEEELALSKLKIAELEAEKDHLELKNRKNRGSRGLGLHENGIKATMGAVTLL